MKNKAFSLIELLVALSILAVVAAIIIPRFLSVQNQAQDVVAQQIQAELNTTYANWKASGGTIFGANPALADLLYVLTSPGGTGAGVSIPAHHGYSAISDVGTPAENIRLSDLQDVSPSLASLKGSPGAGNAVTAQGGNLLISGPDGADQFSAIAAAGITWGAPVAASPTPRVPYAPGRWFLTINGFTAGVLPGAIEADGKFTPGVSPTGVMYAYDSSTGNYYKINYSTNAPLASLKPKTPLYFAMKGYANYRSMGGPTSPYTWTVTYQIGRR